MHSRKAFVLAVCLLFLLLEVSAAHWATNPVSMEARVRSVVRGLLCILYLMAPGVVFAMITISVIFMILHADNPEKRENAKFMFKNALYGGLMVIALIQIAKMPPVNMYVDLSACLTTAGGGGGAGSGMGTGGYLELPPRGGTVTSFVFFTPFLDVLRRKWLRRIL
ncbi:MAG: hypothetical protein ABH834_02265 [Candidatus Altiarchaeota archaeon]